jgi:hypothetical protein
MALQAIHILEYFQWIESMQYSIALPVFVPVYSQAATCNETHSAISNLCAENETERHYFIVWF